MNDLCICGEGEPDIFKCPVHDVLTDAQAMALVKKFRLSIQHTGRHEFSYGDSMPADEWHVGGLGAHATNEHGDLNRAIAECVAKMKAKA